MFFSFTKNNGTDRDTLSLDIVNFREGIFFMTEVLYHPARDVRLLNSLYLRLPCLYCRMQWWIPERGTGGGGGSPLLLDQNETRKVHPAPTPLHS